MSKKLKLGDLSGAPNQLLVSLPRDAWEQVISYLQYPEQEDLDSISLGNAIAQWLNDSYVGHHELYRAQFVEAARKSAKDGELEFDDNSLVSAGDDPGAYVMGWVWVPNEAAGIHECEECGAALTPEEIENGLNLCTVCEEDI